MIPIDQTHFHAIRQRADDIVGLATKTAVLAHLAYEIGLDDHRRDDAPGTLRTYSSRLVFLRAAISGQIETIQLLLGDPVQQIGSAMGVESPPPVQAISAAPTIPTVLSQEVRLEAAVSLLGELTNAQVQKLMKCDADKAREIIDRLVDKGLLTKVSSKLYIHNPTSGMAHTLD